MPSPWNYAAGTACACAADAPCPAVGGRAARDAAPGPRASTAGAALRFVTLLTLLGPIDGLPAQPPAEASSAPAARGARFARVGVAAPARHDEVEAHGGERVTGPETDPAWASLRTTDEIRDGRVRVLTSGRSSVRGILTTPTGGVLAGRQYRMSFGGTGTPLLSGGRMRTYGDGAHFTITDEERPPTGSGPRFRTIDIAKGPATRIQVSTGKDGLTLRFVDLEVREQFFQARHGYKGRAEVMVTDGTMLGRPDRYRIRLYGMERYGPRPSERDVIPAPVQGEVASGQLAGGTASGAPGTSEEAGIQIAFPLQVQARLQQLSSGGDATGDVQLDVMVDNPLGVSFSRPATVELAYDRVGAGRGVLLERVEVPISRSGRVRHTISRDVLRRRPSHVSVGLYATVDPDGALDALLPRHIPRYISLSAPAFLPLPRQPLERTPPR